MVLHKKTEHSSTEISLYVIISVICTGILMRFNSGISGNDFWWHIKVGEWIVENHTVPKVGIFSWYAVNNNLEWVSHEWLSEVALYSIHNTFGNFGIFLFCFGACIGLFLLVVVVNKQKIIDNLLLSIIFLLFSIIILPTFFFGRPQIFSIYLLAITLLCLYRYNYNQSKLIYFLPVITILWSNLHGGSSNLPYLLCLIFAISGLFGFSYSHLESEKHSAKHKITLFTVTVISLLSIAINPHGAKMILYPYINMGDTSMLSLISEWHAPDAKNLSDLILCFLPIIFVSLVLLLTNKKIKLVDLLVFLLFAYLSFRSLRFVLLFYIASSFIVFEYLPLGQFQSKLSTVAKAINYCLLVFLLVVNIMSGVKIYDTFTSNNLISRSLEDKFITIIKNDNPKRLYNDYNYSDMLIYAGIPTFADARADIFSKTNLMDAFTLMNLKEPRNLKENINKEILDGSILDIEGIVAKYDFDAFLVESDRSLAVYLKSHPEKYRLIKSNENTTYFIVIAD